MGWTWVIIMGLIGAAAGFYMPALSYRVVEYKQKQRDRKVEKHISDHFGIRIASSVFVGACWGLTVYYESDWIITAFVCAFSIVAIIFTLIDWRIHIVPNELLLITVILGVISQLVCYGLQALGLAILCMVALMLIFTVLGLIVGLHKIGAGDVKLVAAMGLILGYPSIFTGISAMSVALLLFIFIGMLSGKLTHVSMFAFAPFMMFGMMIGMIQALVV